MKGFVGRTSQGQDWILEFNQIINYKDDKNIMKHNFFESNHQTNIKAEAEAEAYLNLSH